MHHSPFIGKRLLRCFEDLPSHYAKENIAFSSDEQRFFILTSVEREATT